MDIENKIRTNISQTKTLNELKKTFRQLSLLAHPNRGGSNNLFRFLKNQKNNQKRKLQENKEQITTSEPGTAASRERVASPNNNLDGTNSSDDGSKGWKLFLYVLFALCIIFIFILFFYSFSTTPSPTAPSPTAPSPTAPSPTSPNSDPPSETNPNPSNASASTPSSPIPAGVQCASHAEKIIIAGKEICTRKCRDDQSRNASTGVCECSSSTVEINGTCVPRCTIDQERINGTCVPKCRDDQHRIASTGVCECKGGKVDTNGSCECPSPFVEQANGDCSCQAGNEWWGGQCRPVCDPMVRQSNGSCACADGTELVNGDCLTKCDVTESRNPDTNLCECPRLRNQGTGACCDIERTIQDATENHNPSNLVGTECTCGTLPHKTIDCAGFCGGGSTVRGVNCMEGSTSAYNDLSTGSASDNQELDTSESDFISKCNRVNFVSDCNYIAQPDKCNRSWSSKGALKWKRETTQPDINIYTEIQLPKFRTWLINQNYPINYDHGTIPSRTRAWRVMNQYDESIFDVEKELKSFDAMHPKSFIKVVSTEGVEYYYMKNTDSAQDYSTFNVCQWKNGECMENVIRPYDSRCDGTGNRLCFKSCNLFCGGVCPSHAADRDNILQMTLDIPGYSILVALLVLIALGALTRQYFKGRVSS